MRIAMFAPLLGVEATGLSLAAAHTASQLAAAGHSVTLLGTDCGHRGESVSAFVPVAPQVVTHIFPVRSPFDRRLYRSQDLLHWMRLHIDDFDLLDVQSVWSWTAVDMARLFHKAGKPYVLTPHGSMTTYDWQKGRVRREIFFRTRLGSVWSDADAVRFLSAGELHQSSHPTARGFIVPNGVSLEPRTTAEQRDESRRQLGIPGTASVLLFLGRVTHQKGVKEILAAFEVAASTMPELYLYLVGPAQGNYGHEVLAQVAQSPLRKRIVVAGAVYSDARNAYFRAADAFITLSHNEGLSLAHLEALTYGLPALLTASSHLEELQRYGAGIVTTHDSETAAQAITSLMGDKRKLAQASEQAQKLIAENYAWQKVVPQLVSLYQQAVDRRSLLAPGSAT